VDYTTASTKPIQTMKLMKPRLERAMGVSEQNWKCTCLVSLVDEHEVTCGGVGTHDVLEGRYQCTQLGN